VKGDFTRETFRARRHYWGVLRQQGRVDLDADWNEQVHIARHEHTTRTTDVVGHAGGPSTNAGFGITVADDGALMIGEGRYYVAGRLCENPTPAAFDDQPDPPGETAPDSAGVHLLYLDVWDRHVTALEDPLIKEVALGGPDTATRAQTVWQVRTRAITAVDGLAAALDALAAAEEADGGDGVAEQIEAARRWVQALAAQSYCEDPLAPAGGSLEADAGRLAARTVEVDPDADDPCSFAPGGGYERLDNRLYRVEIHRPGEPGEATFKWSRDNGSVVTAIQVFEGPDRIQVRQLGKDELTTFARQDVIEIIADDDVLAGRPGALRTIEDIDPDRRVLILDQPVAAKVPALRPRVRRWDMDTDDIDPDQGLTVRDNGWIGLEDGVEVRFQGGTYRTGDYWIIPARTATAGVEWPPHPTHPGATVGPPEDLGPMGIAHHRAPLAAVVRDDDGVVTLVDLRRRFPAVTAQQELRYVGGDGQQPELPDGALPHPLQVGVTNGDEPVTGALVQFTVVAGDGGLAADTAITGEDTTITVPTGDAGIASAWWHLDPHLLASANRVEARLLDACADPQGVPVIFTARLDYRLQYLSGDGQEAMPGERLERLRVWVSDGRWPVEGARVTFTVEAGVGRLAADDGDAGTTQLQVETDVDGLASCLWTVDETNQRQQVTARLLDRNDVEIHQAAVAFNATLRRASAVAYAPAGDCVTLQDATTVQDALDELCRREAGGTCTYTVRPGTDVAALFETIDASEIRDLTICFAEGTYEVAEPLTLDGKGRVRVSGAGAATRILATDSEAALQFLDCSGVGVRDLAVEARAAHVGDGLRGALTAINCGTVTIDGVTAVCGNAPEHRATGITVRRDEPGRATGPVRIRSCYVEVGEQQIGILVVNAERTLVEDNTVTPGQLREGETLGRLLENARYRGWARRSLVSFEEPSPPVVALDQPARHAINPLLGEVSVPDWGLTFHSELVGGAREDVWRAEISGRNPRTAREAREAAIAIADEALRNEGRVGTRRVFREWYDALEERFEVTGHAGIVIGGQVADDVHVLRNQVRGTRLAVSVGLSDADGAGHHAGVVEIGANTVLAPGTSIVSDYGDGIVVGNCRSLVVSDNLVQVVAPAGHDIGVWVDGVRIDGFLGPRAIVRANHFDGTQVGAAITPRNPEASVKTIDPGLRASATLRIHDRDVADGDTMTIGDRTYVFLKELVSRNETVTEIAIGRTIGTTRQRIVDVINGDGIPGEDLGGATDPHPDVMAALRGTDVVLTARTPGTAGDGIVTRGKFADPDHGFARKALEGGREGSIRIGTRPPRTRWVAVDNVATTGRMLVAPCSVVDQDNVPRADRDCEG
jgi:hypothetical protein